MPLRDTRSIDALLAEYVMGAKPGDYPYWQKDCQVLAEHGILMFRPSINPAASKQLRDRMRAEGWEYSIQFRFGEFDAFFRRPVSGEFAPTFEADADTEEMAVALATLRAKGIMDTAPERKNA